MMNEQRVSPSQALGAENTYDSDRSSIRSQLLWASLFPLVFFGLLSIMVISSAMNKLALNLVLQRNTAQVQLLAETLSEVFTSGSIPTQFEMNSQLQSINPDADSQLFVIDTRGDFATSSVVNVTGLPLEKADLLAFIDNKIPTSRKMIAIGTSDDIVVSYAALPGSDYGVILTEPWKASMLPTFIYQPVLIGLFILGALFSLIMLSVSITRITRPITLLAKNASMAVPGSVFHPTPIQGPLEIRSLIIAFNQMVIRLAEQHSMLRQYAHKELISQEEERQRLSHELHDGTVQDLIGLSQRIELCRNEMESNPQAAKHRLDELQGLVEHTIDDVRRISIALRPPVLEDFGLSMALKALCNDLKQDNPQLQCEFSMSGNEQRLPPDIELVVYRVVQESLTNIRKHVPDASLVQVELIFKDSEIQAVVKNNGTVFLNQDVHSFLRSGHFGVAGMYERARLFGGSLNITSDPIKNTIVSLNLPFSQDIL